MKKRVGGIIFGLAVGVTVALLSYRWITDTGYREQRLREEQVVHRARVHLVDIVSAGALEIVDPLAPDRKFGKVYIYPAGSGWEVSGFYRRNDRDLWHPYLMQLDSTLALAHLKVSEQDPALIDRALTDPKLEVVP